MAPNQKEAGVQAGKDEQPAASEIEPDVEDSIELKYAGEYSDETKDMLRKYPRPRVLEEESSLDPEEDLELMLEHKFKLPPHVYDEVQQAGKEVMDSIKQSMNTPLSPQEQAEIQYRHQLVHGTAPEDVKWLKLKAYHRAMDRIRAAKAAERDKRKQQLLQEYEVPTDVVPKELLEATPEELVVRKVQHLREQQQKQAHSKASCPSTSTTPSSRPHMGHGQPQQHQLSPGPSITSAANDIVSEESEWDPSWRSSSHADHPYCSSMQTLQLLAAEQQEASTSEEGLSFKDLGAELVYVESEDVQYTPYRSFTPEYQEVVRLQRQARRQQLQQSLAFWGSLLTVAATSLVKVLRDRQRRAQARAKAARASEAGSTASSRRALAPA